MAWSEGQEAGGDWYEALEVAPDVFFINMTFSARPAEDEAFIVNTRTRRVLSVRERVRDAPAKCRASRASRRSDGRRAWAMPPLRPAASRRRPAT